VIKFNIQKVREQLFCEFQVTKVSKNGNNNTRSAIGMEGRNTRRNWRNEKRRGRDKKQITASSRSRSVPNLHQAASSDDSGQRFSERRLNRWQAEHVLSNS